MSGGYSLVVVLRLLIAMVSLVAEHRLGAWASVVVEHRLSTHGTQAWLLHSLWNLPRLGIKPMSPALAGRFLSTVPPEKSDFFMFLKQNKKEA